MHPEEYEEASNSIKTAIEAQRTDALKAVLDTIKKSMLYILLCCFYKFTLKWFTKLYLMDRMG